MYKNQNLNEKIIVSLMLAFLIISTPFSSAQVEKKEVGKEETEGFLSATIPEEGEDFLEGQQTDVNIIVNRYEPTTLVSSLLEEQNVPVYAFLSATPTSSTTLPRIQRVTITEVKGNRSFTTGVRYHEPKVWAWDDIGYLELRLKSIAKEHKVPDKIFVDLKARIEYEADITSSLIGGGQTKILKETPTTSLQDVIFDETSDIFGGKGHIVLRQVSSNNAIFSIYDSEGKLITTTSVGLNRDSAPISLVQGSNLPENQLRIRLNKIIDENQAIAKVSIDNLEHVLNKGTRILDWRVTDIVDKKVNAEDIKYIRLIKEGTTDEIYLFEGDSEKIKTDFYNNNNINDFNKKVGIEFKDDRFNLFKDNFLKIERDWGRFEVKEINSGKKPIARFKISGGTKTVEEGKEILEGTSGCSNLGDKNKCILKDIQLSRVIIQHPDKQLNSNNCIITSTQLVLRNTDKRYLSEEFILPYDSNIDTLNSRFCNGIIQLESIETFRSVEVSLLSGYTKGVTETQFRLDIPIEKRLIDLSPKSLDKKINSTQELIEKLTKTIDRLETVVESWTKVCLATTAIFTIYNFLFGNYETKETEVEKSNFDIFNKAGKYTSSGDKCNEAGGFKKLTSFYDSPPSSSEEKDKTTRKEVFIKVDKKDKTVDYYFVENNDRCEEYLSAVIYNEDGVESAYNPRTGIVEPIKRFDSDEQGYIKVIKDEQGKNIVLIPIKSSAQLRQASLVIGKQYKEWKTKYGDATKSYYLLYYENDRVEVRKGVGKVDLGSKPREDDDFFITTYTKGSDSTGVYNEIERVFIRPVSLAQKRGASNLNILGEPYKIDTTKKINRVEIECEKVLGPEQCKIMYNACDPVMCPASRCNLGGAYDVPNDNVIQSGLIGSVILCAPNFIGFKGDVIVPICLSGILASLKNIRSYLQAYKSCLITAKADDKAVGICDKIRSIFMCEIIWKEAMTLFNLRGGGFSFASKIPGIGNLLDYAKPRVERAKQTADFFTQSYATTIFAAYKGKTTEQIGAEICKSAIGGAMPNLGNFVNEISKPEDPPQFTAYFEEHDYSQTLGESRYNVYYHIYSGTPRQSAQQIINYYVFLKKQGLREIPIAKGSLKSGEFADESKDFRGARGYQEVCISLNGKVECGFGKVVSSSFGINQLANKYFAENLAAKITKAEQCVPSQQSALSSYSSGLIPTAAVERRCSTTNPYLGLTKEKEEEWYDIGDCGIDDKGNTLGRCWEHANLEKLPQIQAQVYKDSCTENQDATLCEVNQKCVDGAVLREFNIKAETPLLTKTVGTIGIRECCTGKCKPISIDIDNKITESITLFKGKEKIVKETVDNVLKLGISKYTIDNEFIFLGEENSNYKNEFHYLMSLFYTRSRAYKLSFEEIEQININIEGKEDLAKGALSELATFYSEEKSGIKIEELPAELKELKKVVKNLIEGKTETKTENGGERKENKEKRRKTLDIKIILVSDLEIGDKIDNKEIVKIEEGTEQVSIFTDIFEASIVAKKGTTLENAKINNFMLGGSDSF